jgi:hypothetical protein
MRDGVLGVLARALARDGVLTGYVSLSRARLGCAEVWGQGPSLWLPVVEALGFTVLLAVFPASPWRRCMESYYTNTRFLERPPRRRNTQEAPSVFFMDGASVPPTEDRFWASFHCPVLVTSLAESFRPLSGWSVITRSFKHSQVGGQLRLSPCFHSAPGFDCVCTGFMAGVGALSTCHYCRFS